MCADNIIHWTGLVDLP